MNLWEAKQHQLETLIDYRIEDDAKNYNVLTDMSSLVTTCSSVQLSQMVEMVKVHPALGNIPSGGNAFTTIYDIIEFNIRSQLMEHGIKYYTDKYQMLND